VSGDRARKTILEMLAATMDLSESDEIQAMVREYGADVERFPEAERREVELKDDNPMYVRDYSKCLLCWRCVQVCRDDAQYTYAINSAAAVLRPRSALSLTAPFGNDLCSVRSVCRSLSDGRVEAKREYLLQQGVSPAEISVLNTGERNEKTFERPHVQTLKRHGRDYDST